MILLSRRWQKAELIEALQQGCIVQAKNSNMINIVRSLTLQSALLPVHIEHKTFMF